MPSVNKDPRLQGTTIPWEEMLKGVNRTREKPYPSVRYWLSKLYNRSHKKKVAPLARKLGVSPLTVKNTLIDLGIIKNIQRGERKPTTKELFYAIPKETMATMTMLEIVQEVGYCADSKFYQLMKESGRDYIRKRARVTKKGVKK